MPGKDLVTESCVRQMAPGSVLRLSPDKIATPAALDLCYEKGIRVVHGEEGAARDGGGGATSPLWEAIKAGDGTYVVVVKNGEATVSRLEEGGPRPFGTE